MAAEAMRVQCDSAPLDCAAARCCRPPRLAGGAEGKWRAARAAGGNWRQQLWQSAQQQRLGTSPRDDAAVHTRCNERRGDVLAGMAFFPFSSVCSKLTVDRRRHNNAQSPPPTSAQTRNKS